MQDLQLNGLVVSAHQRKAGAKQHAASLQPLVPVPTHDVDTLDCEAQLPFPSDSGTLGSHASDMWKSAFFSASSPRTKGCLLVCWAWALCRQAEADSVVKPVEQEDLDVRIILEVQHGTVLIQGVRDDNKVHDGLVEDCVPLATEALNASGKAIKVLEILCGQLCSGTYAPHPKGDDT
ncbi:hypothetical protein H0H81_012484 [Sphagnurus paluster]|uniref:Uncharacterized protein n=1 Tax=Sphagnurus paluster TaxID=117069 RepID=A0A9P7KI06_9AGAR|nr:hypothetical protein H0H81_012484 [Sphagnurus paluster]